MWLLRSRLSSQQDRTQKLVFTDGGRTAEVSYIDKQDGKDILCVPTQVGCAMSCSFCQITDLEGKVINLSGDDIYQLVYQTYNELKLNEHTSQITPSAALLISYMGCGEPLANHREVLKSMLRIKEHFGTKQRVRFALATIFPKRSFEDFVELAESVKHHRLDLKIHWSLHFTTDETRRAWMPAAEDINSSLLMLRWYRAYTHNAIEVHYTLIDTVNDNHVDGMRLISYLGKDVPLKFLHFRTKPSLGSVPSTRMEEMASYIATMGGCVEIYNPPGQDVGSSCGQFLLDEYRRVEAEPLVQIAQ